MDEENDALLPVSPTEFTVLVGDFNAHFETDTDTVHGRV